MANSVKLKVGATEIEFSPDLGYRQPGMMKTLRFRALSGKLFSYKFFSKEKWELPVSWIPKADADQINTWWESDTDVDFYPDLINNPGTFFTSKILGNERPLDQYSGPNWETFFGGNIDIEEIG